MKKIIIWFLAIASFFSFSSFGETEINVNFMMGENDFNRFLFEEEVENAKSNIQTVLQSEGCVLMFDLVSKIEHYGAFGYYNGAAISGIADCKEKLNFSGTVKYHRFAWQKSKFTIVVRSHDGRLKKIYKFSGVLIDEIQLNTKI